MEQLERDSCGFLSDSGFAVAEMTPAAFLLDQWELFFLSVFINMGELEVLVVAEPLLWNL